MKRSVNNGGWQYRTEDRVNVPIVCILAGLAWIAKE
jgi:hypothetical protein